MYSDKNKKDMWWVERHKEKKGLPDYYGPFNSKEEAEVHLDFRVKDEA